MSKPKLSELSYEEAYARLEKIVEALENGDQGLDKSLQLFEEGIKLSKICNDRLNEAEARLEKLMADANGELKREEFVVEGNRKDEEDFSENDLPF